MKKLIPLTILLQAAVLLLASTATMDAVAATDKDAKEKQAAVHRLQMQLNAAQQEKSDLAGQVDALKKQLGDMESKRESKRAALEKKLGGQSKQLAELTDKLQKTELADKQQLAELAGKYQDTEKKLAQMEQQYSASNKELQQTRAEKEQEKRKLDGDVRVCEKKNSELYSLSVKLMDKYQAKGVMEAMRQTEPFTQLEKVKIENLLQEYRDKANDNRIASGSNGAQDAQRH